MSALYLYPVWLRLWHWLNALLFLTLVVTGTSMHFNLNGLIPFDVAVPVHSDPERREARLASNCVGKEKDLRIIPGNRGKV
jgi:hypothetical protein